MQQYNEQYLADIVNQVLNELGRLPVADFTKDQAGLLIANKAIALRSEFLARTDWNFAIKYVTDNTPLTINISPEYPYNYQLPADYVRMDRISWFTISFGLIYRIIDNIIMTNVRPIQYYYVSNSALFSAFDEVSYRAFILYVAADICAPITNDEKLTAYLERKYRDKLADAIRRNDMDRQVLTTPYNDFLRQTYI